MMPRREQRDSVAIVHANQPLNQTQAVIEQPSSQFAEQFGRFDSDPHSTILTVDCLFYRSPVPEMPCPAEPAEPGSARTRRFRAGLCASSGPPIAKQEKQTLARKEP